MAVLVLILLGAIMGWLASIIARTEAPGAILRQVAIGLITALVAGTIANGGTMLGRLSLPGLGAALVVSAAVLALYHAILRRRAGL